QPAAAQARSREEDRMTRLMSATLLAAIGLALASSTGSAAEILWPSYMWGEANNAPVMTELKKKFEAETPGTTVQSVTVPPNIFWDKQFADVSSGHAADIATMFDPELRAYIEADTLEPLDPYLAEAGLKLSDFIATAGLAEKDGRLYAVPMQIN